MIGQLVLTAGGRGRAAPDSLYGLPVLRAEVALEGFWGERRLRRACRALCRGRARRALVLREDGLWSRLEELGLRPVDPVPFLRAQAVPLALADLALFAGAAGLLLGRRRRRPARPPRRGC